MGRRKPVSLSRIYRVSFLMRSTSMEISTSMRRYKSEPLSVLSLSGRFLYDPSSINYSWSWRSPSGSSIILKSWIIKTVIIIKWILIWRIKRIIFRLFIIFIFLKLRMTFIRRNLFMRESITLFKIFIKWIRISIKLILRLIFTFHHFLSIIFTVWTFLILMIIVKVSQFEFCSLS